MKKATNKTNKPGLVLRREHLRLLTPVDLQKVVGGAPSETSGTCQLASKHLEGSCA